MSEAKGTLRRMIAKLRAIFEEDWTAKAGSVFRRGVSTISEVNEEYLQLGEKVAEAPDLAWTAVRGLAGEKHAKAVADYARAENERIDLELKKRVLEDKVRQERATTQKLEAEAGQARLAELKARAELFESLQTLGVTITVDKEGLVLARRSEQGHVPAVHNLFTLPEKLLLGMIVDVKVPKFAENADREVETRITKWYCSVGSFVRRGQNLFEVGNSLGSQGVRSPVSGIVVEIFLRESEVVRLGQTVACRIDERD